MRSLAQFGQRTPLVVGRSNYILKGNGTYLAMQQLGWKRCQIVCAQGLTPAEELAYALADNKTTDLSRFDFEGVSAIIGELAGTELDLASTGFRDFEIQPMLAAEWVPPKDPGEMPKAAAEAGVQLRFSKKEWTEVEAYITDARKRGDAPVEATDANTILALLRLYVPSRIRRITKSRAIQCLR